MLTDNWTISFNNNLGVVTLEAPPDLDVELVYGHDVILLGHLGQRFVLKRKDDDARTQNCVTCVTKRPSELRRTIPLVASSSQSVRKIIG